MISKEDFIHDITSYGLKSRLKFMPLEQIRSLRKTEEYGMCVLVTRGIPETELFGSMNINTGYGYANMLLYNPRYSKHSTYFTSGSVHNICGNEDWNDLEYYIIPSPGEPLNIEELI